MKKHLALLLCAGLLGSAPVLAQRTCATDEYQRQQELEHPELAKSRYQAEREIENWIGTSSTRRGSSTVITIPVVVHVVYANSTQNIADSYIHAQIAKLNEDFRKTNSDFSTVPAVFAPFGADTEIEFCLAVRDPQGNPTTGITRTQTSVSAFSTNNLIKSDATGGKSAWDRNKYLNLWVGNLSNDLLGYAQFPGGAAANDGVVVLYNSLPGFPGGAPFNGGRTATHEIGHWLGLFHIWGNTLCGDDQVADTPQQREPNYGPQFGGCTSFPHHSTCTVSNAPNGDMFMNYMDYGTDQCLVMFTTGQKTRMTATLNTSRASLLTSNGCVPVQLQALDAGITAITAPGASVCAGPFSPQVTLRNYGSTALTSATINYRVDNGPISTFNWTGSLASLATTTVTLPSISTTAGNHTLTVYTTSPNGGADGNAANDSFTKPFVATNSAAGIVPAAPEGFEAAAFPPVGYTRNNPDNAVTWARTVAAAKTGAASMFMDFYNYNAAGQTDELVMPNIDLSSIPNAKLTFEVAYKFYQTAQGTSNDSLRVLISTDCGQTFTSVYYKGGATLATGPGAGGMNSAFTPTGPEFWRREMVDLSAYTSSNSAIIKFRGINRYGNNLYIDDIMISSIVASTESLLLNSQVALYPNPTTGTVSIRLTEEAAAGAISLEVVDVLGQVVANHALKNGSDNTYSFDLNHLANGVYMARINTARGTAVQRFVISK